MTFEQVLGTTSNSDYRISDKFYQDVVNLLGYEEVKKCIPFTLGELKRAYKNDQRFSTLPIRNWDYAAGFIARGPNYNYVGSSLTKLYKVKCGVTSFSCATGVCILKECARMWVEESNISTKHMSAF